MFKAKPARNVVKVRMLKTSKRWSAAHIVGQMHRPTWRPSRCGPVFFCHTFAPAQFHVGGSLPRHGIRMKPIALGITLILALTVSARETASIHIDQPFPQDYAEKISLAPPMGNVKLVKVCTDRDGHVVVLSNRGLLQLDAAHFTPDRRYRPLADMNVTDLEIVRGKFIYLTE